MRLGGGTFQLERQGQEVSDGLLSGFRIDFTTDVRKCSFVRFLSSSGLNTMLEDSEVDVQYARRAHVSC